MKRPAARTRCQTAGDCPDLAVPWKQNVFSLFSRAVCLVALATGLAAGCDFVPPGKPDPANRPRVPSQISDFGVLVAQNCAGCHGADGRLGPAPPLRDPLFLAIVSDEALVEVISHGRAGTPMPAFAEHHSGTLTDRQIELIARGLKQHWSAGKLPPAPLPEYAQSEGPDKSSGDAARGAPVFTRACAGCHGEDGAGSGADEKPGPLNDPSLLALISDQALRRIIITGRPDLGMPDFAGDEGRDGDFSPLTNQEIDDLVALLASWRRGPAPMPTHKTAAIHLPIPSDR
jgi:mono/diheme cytochrome c family protein